MPRAARPVPPGPPSPLPFAFPEQPFSLLLFFFLLLLPLLFLLSHLLIAERQVIDGRLGVGLPEEIIERQSPRLCRGCCLFPSLRLSSFPIASPLGPAITFRGGKGLARSQKRSGMLCLKNKYLSLSRPLSGAFSSVDLEPDEIFSSISFGDAKSARRGLLVLPAGQMSP